MNLESLLNRRPTLLESTTRLTSLVLKFNRQEIEAKSLLLKKRKETSKQRIKTFRNIKADANQKDNTNSLYLVVLLLEVVCHSLEEERLLII